MTQSLPTAHVTVQMGLRASRVAYLVPGDEDWHSTARTALHQLTNLWAGAGFVVVPVTSRDVHHALIAALRAYDPDMVLIPAGNSPVPVTTSKHLARAQETISAACANYRRPGADDKQAVMPGFGEVADTYLSESGMIRMTPLDLIVDRAAYSPVGAHPCLGGALGVAAAALWGLSEPPRNEVHPLPCGLQRSAVWRLIARTTTDAEDLHGVTTQNKHEGVYSTEFERTRFGLTDVFELGPDEQPPILIVWGDASDDFALAMAWDRTYRFGIWIPDEWWQDEVTHGSVVQAVITMAMRAGIAGRKFIHTSTSLPLSAVEERMNACKLETVELLDGEAFAVPNRLANAVAPSELDYPRFYKSHDAISGRSTEEWSMSVLRGTDNTIEFAMLPPAPLINVPGLEKIQSRANWQVDLDVRDHQIPSTTAIKDDSLLVHKNASFATRIRSSRGGISFASHRTDFVFASSSVEQKLSRPFVRVPSLLAWSRERARGYGMTVTLSSAGAQAEQLAVMLGSRDNLAEMLSSPLLSALQAFNVGAKASRDAYPERDGCVVRGDGYLSYKAICARAEMDSEDSASRDRIDDLLSCGILHRGLVVRCAVCTQVSFVPIEDVATRIRCQRCLASTALSREGWRQPTEEPQWFYDLHPIARQLTDANGHVPLQLSRHLRQNSRLGYTDTPEFELIEDGKRRAETDLLALADRRLNVAEAKISNTLGEGKVLNNAARKRVLAAKVFAADEIVLATTAPRWDDTSIKAVKSAIDNEQWATGTPPRLRVITHLGTGDVHDSVRSA